MVRFHQGVLYLTTCNLTGIKMQVILIQAPDDNWSDDQRLHKFLTIFHYCTFKQGRGEDRREFTASTTINGIEFRAEIGVTCKRADLHKLSGLTNALDILSVAESLGGYKIYAHQVGSHWTDGGYFLQMVRDGKYTHEDTIPKPTNPNGSYVKSPPGGRAYLVETKEQFRDRILQLEDDPMDEGELDDIDSIVTELAYTESSKLHRDLAKVEFDFENCDSEWQDGKDYGFFGHQQIGDLNFIGFRAGGDWEHPVHFIVYWDGHDLRGYVPDDGNTYNKKTKTAYGSEPSSDEEWDGEDVEADYGKMLERIKKRFKL